MLSVFFTFFMWSSSFAFSKGLLSCATPLFSIAVRMLIAGIALLSVAFVKQGFRFKIPVKAIVPLLMISATAMFIPNYFELVGLKGLTAAKASFIYGLTPFLSAIISYFQLTEKMTFKKILGLFLGFSGFIFALCNPEDLSSSLLVLPSKYDLALLVATISSSWGWVLIRKIRTQGQYNLSVFTINGFSMFMAGAAALLTSSIVDKSFVVSGASWKNFAINMAGLLLISNVICHNLYGKLLKKHTATFLSLAGMSSPIFASIFGFLFLREPFSLKLVGLSLMLMLGIALYYSEELKQGYITKKTTKPVV